LQPITRLPAIQLDDLHDIEQQKARIDANTRHFVAGQPANNVLLTGTRGSGKSSLIKALLNAYAAEGLRVIEVEKGDLTDLPDIVELIDGRPERFIIFCDDLSFDSGDARYKALKVVLDGSIAAAPKTC
jgi:predicted AAA+ superfamily ATPase